MFKSIIIVVICGNILFIDSHLLLAVYTNELRRHIQLPAVKPVYFQSLGYVFFGFFSTLVRRKLLLHMAKARHRGLKKRHIPALRLKTWLSPNPSLWLWSHRVISYYYQHLCQKAVDYERSAAYKTTDKGLMEEDTRDILCCMLSTQLIQENWTHRESYRHLSDPATFTIRNAKQLIESHG